MFITTVYKKLNSSEIEIINNFLISHFKNNKYMDNIDFEFEPNTIIIMELLNNEIIGCVCLLDNKHLINKINVSSIKTYYNIKNDMKGFIIYNLCVHKDHRNKKIADKLIKEVINLVKQLDVKYVHTLAENEISKKVFTNNNFTEYNIFLDIFRNQIYNLELIF